jgi:flagellar biosynthesis protein FlhF
MRIKTFYAKTMAEALQDIKSGLGPDALLLSTKEIRGRSCAGIGSSGFEVVAATDSRDDLDQSSACADRSDATDARLPLSQDEKIGPTEAALLESAVYSPVSVPDQRADPESEPSAGKKSQVRKTSRPSPGGNKPPFAGAVLLDLYNDLIQSGVHDWLAERLVSDAITGLTPKQRSSRPVVFRALAGVARALISDSPNEDGLPAKRVVAFVGPTGVGKTTSIAKLAAYLALLKRKKVVLMTLDSHRIGAVEQLRTYAGLMGIPFRFVSQVSELAKAIEDQAQRDYILIDTEGRGPREWVALHDLAAFLQKTSDIERHLVLSATTKPSDLKEAVDRFEICRPDQLFFTKLDETTTLGAIFNELVRTRKPLSYYTDGQKVPEDLHTVSRERLIDIVLHRN